MTHNKIRDLHEEFHKYPKYDKEINPEQHGIKALTMHGMLEAFKQVLDALHAAEIKIANINKKLPKIQSNVNTLFDSVEWLEKEMSKR